MRYEKWIASVIDFFQRFTVVRINSFCVSTMNSTSMNNDLYCTSIPSIALLDFTLGFTILLASLWAIAGAAFVCTGIKLRFAPSFSLMATFAMLYCACKCAWFATDAAFVLPTPGLMFEAVARLLGCLQLVCFIAIGRSMIDSSYHDRSLRRVVVALTVFAVADAAIIGIVAGLFDEFSDPTNDGLIVVLFFSDLLDVLVAAVSFFGAVRCAQAARDGFLTADAQCNVKWHHRFTLFGAFFCSSRLFASLVSLVLFGLLVAERDRAPLRGSIELGRALCLFDRDGAAHVSRARAGLGARAVPQRCVAGRAPLDAAAHASPALAVSHHCLDWSSTVTLAVWGMHSSCSLDAAPLGGGLAAARAGAVPLYFLIPFDVCARALRLCELFSRRRRLARSFPRDAGDSIALHKLLAGLTFDLRHHPRGGPLLSAACL
jgi:hypothetical protein